MANPYLDDPKAASEAAAERTGNTVSKIGSYLNAGNLLGRVSGLTGSWRSALGWGSGTAWEELTRIPGAASGAAGAAGTATTAASAAATGVTWSGVAQTIGTWAPALVAAGGGIEVLNDVRNHEYKKAGVATVKTAVMAGTVFAEGALLVGGYLTGGVIFAAEAASLLFTGKGLSGHIGGEVASWFESTDKTPTPASVAPYGVALNRQVIPPTVNYVSTPGQINADGIVQVLPATGQVMTATAPLTELAAAPAGVPFNAPANGWANQVRPNRAAANAVLSDPQTAQLYAERLEAARQIAQTPGALSQG